MTNPDPVAFTIFGFSVRWYGILIAGAMILCLLIAIKRCPAKGFKKDDLIDFFIAMVPSIVVGARLYYVIFEWDYYSVHLSEIFAIRNGGLAIHGGLIAGILCAFIVCRVKKISFWTLADLVMPVVPLGQAIGRWGNFFNGEAHGTVTNLPWAITVYDESLGGLVSVHPTFLYESIWDLLLFVILMIYDKKWKRCDGEMLFLYMIGYSLGRFWIEALRTDSLMILGMRQAQLISLAAIVIGIIGFIWLRKRSQNRLKGDL